MDFAKQAAEALFPGDEIDHGAEPQADETDHATMEAKKNHWKKWLAALGILGGVGAGYYMYNRPGANGRSAGRNMLESAGLTKAPDLGPDPSGARFLTGATAGALSPEIRHLPGIKKWINPNHSLHQLAGTAKEIGKPLAKGAVEPNANSNARQLNAQLGDAKTDKLRQILDTHINHPTNAKAPSADPITAAGRLRAAVTGTNYEAPVPMKTNPGLWDKIVNHHASGKDATRAIGHMDWLDQNPNVAGGGKAGTSAKAIRAMLPAGMTPGSFARDLTGIRDAKGPGFLGGGGKGLLGRAGLAGLGGWLGRQVNPANRDNQ